MGSPDHHHHHHRRAQIWRRNPRKRWGLNCLIRRNCPIWLPQRCTSAAGISRHHRRGENPRLYMRTQLQVGRNLCNLSVNDLNDILKIVQFYHYSLYVVPSWRESILEPLGQKESSDIPEVSKNCEHPNMQCFIQWCMGPAQIGEGGIKLLVYRAAQFGQIFKKIIYQYNYKIIKIYYHHHHHYYSIKNVYILYINWKQK